MAAASSVSKAPPAVFNAESEFAALKDGLAVHNLWKNNMHAHFNGWVAKRARDFRVVQTGEPFNSFYVSGCVSGSEIVALMAGAPILPRRAPHELLSLVPVDTKTVLSLDEYLIADAIVKILESP